MEGRLEKIQYVLNETPVEVSYSRTLYQLGQSLNVVDIQQSRVLDSQVKLVKNTVQLRCVEYRCQAHNFCCYLGVLGFVMLEYSDHLHCQLSEPLLFVLPGRLKPPLCCWFQWIILPSRTLQQTKTLSQLLSATETFSWFWQLVRSCGWCHVLGKDVIHSLCSVVCAGVRWEGAGQNQRPGERERGGTVHREECAFLGQKAHKRVPGILFLL